MANKVLNFNLVDELIYHSYVYNRKLCPEIQPERWIAIFPNAIELEKKYQEEINETQSS